MFWSDLLLVAESVAEYVANLTAIELLNFSVASGLWPHQHQSHPFLENAYPFLEDSIKFFSTNFWNILLKI